MKTMTFLAPGTAQEFSRTSHKLHQDALIETAQAIIKALGIDDAEWTVLFGLVATAGTPDWVINAGAIYHDGEVYLCDGIAGNDGGDVPVLTITETNIGAASKLSTFGTAQTNFDRKLVLSFAAADSADVNFSDLVRVEEKLTELLDIQALIDDSIVGKANKAQGAWTNITLLANFSVKDGQTPQYRIDQFGIVHLRGQIKIDGAATNLIAAGGIPDIPTGTAGAIHVLVTSVESGVPATVSLLIYANGAVDLQGGYAAAHINDSFYLNGISYATEEY